MHLLYLIGQPGSGKSTLSKLLTAGLAGSADDEVFAKTSWATEPPVIELGARRDAFSGTDALSMSVQPKVVAWLSFHRPPLVLAEGDRLANGKFVEAMLGLGYDVRLARLLVSDAVAAHRRAARASELGVALQNDAWLKGRVSKNRKLAEDWPERVLELDADQPPERVLNELVASGNPVAAVLGLARA